MCDLHLIKMLTLTQLLLDRGKPFEVVWHRCLENHTDLLFLPRLVEHDLLLVIVEFFLFTVVINLVPVWHLRLIVRLEASNT